MTLKITLVEPLDPEAEAQAEQEAASAATSSPASIAAAMAASSSPFKPGRAARWAMSWRDGVWLFMATLTPIISYIGNLGFAPLVGLVGIACLPVIPPARRRWVGMGILAGLMFWALLSQIWSPYHLVDPNFLKGRDSQQMTGIKLVLQLAFSGLVVASAMAVRAPAANRGLTIIGVGFGLLVALLLIEGFMGEPIYQALKVMIHQPTRPDLARRNVARACYTLALLAWPAALYLWSLGERWRLLAGFVVVGSMVASVMLQVDSPIVAIVVGGLVMAAVQKIGRPAITLAITGTILYFILTPLVMSEVFGGSHSGLAPGVGKASWGARVEIWRFVSRLVESKPLFGWGLDASRVFPGVIPLHPHNAALQIWLELGAVGAGITAIFFVWLFARIENMRRRDAPLAGAAAASVSAYLVIGALSFGTWQEWWLALGTIAIVVILVMNNARLRRPVRARDALSVLLPL